MSNMTLYEQTAKLGEIIQVKGLKEVPVSKLEFVGTAEMRQSAMVCIFQAMKYDAPSRVVKKLFNSKSQDGDTHALMDLDSAIWHEFLMKADQVGRNYRRPDPQRVRLTGSFEKPMNGREIGKGYRIVAPYNPKEPKAISFELWREKEVLTITV